MRGIVDFLQTGGGKVRIPDLSAPADGLRDKHTEKHTTQGLQVEEGLRAA